MSSLIPSPDYGYSAPNDSIPSPDYNATYKASQAPTNLIPPPDYIDGRPYDPKVDYEKTIRYTQKRFGNRLALPKFNNNNHLIYTSGSSNTRSVSPVTNQVVPQARVVQEVVHHNNNVKVEEPTSPSPKDNFIAHSYLEDKGKINPDDYAKSKSIKSHIKNIGVPVFPGMMPGDASAHVDSDEEDISPAFLRHLENHKSFDTMRSLRSCHLCVLMAKKGLIDIETGALLFNITAPTKVRKHVKDLFLREEAGEWTHTRRSYEKKFQGEMSVAFGEKIQVFERTDTHALCERSDGTCGWLPISIV
ncbi:unnamed protein product [Auanema sp. JU1783]|nr:unnamed protein product [Auanema sp. JU1783]